MKKSEIKIGGLYLAKVSDRVVTVRVDSISTAGHYNVTNLATGRKTTFRSAAKFRGLAPEPRKITGLSVGPLGGLITETDKINKSEVDTKVAFDNRVQENIETAPDNADESEDEQSPDPTAAGVEEQGYTSASEDSRTNINQAARVQTDRNTTVGELSEEDDNAGESEDEQGLDPTSVQSVENASETVSATTPAPNVDITGAMGPVRTSDQINLPPNLAARLATTRRQVGTPVAGLIPNEEQEKILAVAEQIQAALRGAEVKIQRVNGQWVLVVVAGAGSGKTATCRMLEQTMQGRGQYTAFNKKLVVDSKAKFKRIPCNTTHSLAFKPVGKLFAHRLDQPRIKTWKVAQMMGIEDMFVTLKNAGPPASCNCEELGFTVPPDGHLLHHPDCQEGKRPDVPKRIEAHTLASLVLEGIRRFCQSADRCIDARYIPNINGIDNPIDENILHDLREDAEAGDPEAIETLRLTQGGRIGRDNNDLVKAYLLPKLQATWEDMCDPAGTLPYTADAYVKLWQLGQGNDRPVIGADFILLDEYQDTAEVFIDILRQQKHAVLVMVGDDNQRIYEWRGAKNAAEYFPGAPRCLLSQSYRFGQIGADVANAILAHLDEPTDLVMKGNPDIPTRVYEIAEPRCWLFRTNAGAVGQVMNEIANGKSPFLVGGAEDIVKFCRAAIDLQARPPRRTSHPELACFDSWFEVQEYVKTPEGADLRLMVKLIDEFGAEMIKEALEHMPKEEDADVIISTAHKSKGLEWPTVKLGTDFPTLNKMRDEELRLLYVAATRCQIGLDISVCPTFCGGEDFESGWIPGIHVNYSVPMPSEENQERWKNQKTQSIGAKGVDGLSTKTENTTAATSTGRSSRPQTSAGTTTRPNEQSTAQQTVPNGAEATEWTWARAVDKWGVRGPANVAIGTRVKVTRRDGSSSTVTLKSVMTRWSNAWVYEV